MYKGFLKIYGGVDLKLVVVSPTLFRGGPPMNAGKTLFSQLMDCLPWSTFARIVARYHGDHSVQTFHAPNNTGPWRSPN